MKTLVTGGAGCIGSHLVDLMILEGHDVAVVDHLVSGNHRHLNPRARFYRLDIRSATFERVLRVERPEVVFHQAAQMSVKASTDNPRYDAEINVLGLVNVLEACVVAGVRKMVFASSGATYGNPLYLPIDEDYPQRPASPYAISNSRASTTSPTTGKRGGSSTPCCATATCTGRAKTREVKRAWWPSLPASY